MIRLSYRNTGEVNGAWIYVGEGFAPVPIDLSTLSIDWALIDYAPTRDAIKAAWDAWAEGKDLAYEFRTIAPPLPPVEQVAAEAHNAIAVQAKSQIDAVVGITSAFEVGGWERKRIEAEQVQSGAVLPSDSMLVQEAAAAGITVEELADLIQQKAAQFVSLSAHIKGTERKHKLAIDAIAADAGLTDEQKVQQIRDYNFT